MLDRILSAASFLIGSAAIVFGLFLAFKASGALLEELVWFFAALNIAMGSMVILWALKGQRWLTQLITKKN